jgi:hypothetical protein
MTSPVYGMEAVTLISKCYHGVNERLVTLRT